MDQGFTRLRPTSSVSSSAFGSSFDDSATRSNLHDSTARCTKTSPELGLTNLQSSPCNRQSSPQAELQVVWEHARICRVSQQSTGVVAHAARWSRIETKQKQPQSTA
eukprot:411319-Amphidinium_carterae.1